MRYIVIPSDIELEHAQAADGSHPKMKFVDFVRKVLVGHADVFASPDSVDQFSNINDGIKGLVAGEVLALQDAEHEFLGRIARTFQYAPEFKLAALPFLKAIMSAGVKAPESAKAAEGPSA